MEINENVESVLIVLKQKENIIRHAYADVHLIANNDIIWICEKESMVNTIYNAKEILYFTFTPLKD